jgi:hypothetical protein
MMSSNTAKAEVQHKTCGTTSNPTLNLPHTTMTTYTEQLTEEYVQNAFHSYLKSSLTQAKVERLLDADMLSSAEGDLMITGNGPQIYHFPSPSPSIVFQVQHCVSILLLYAAQPNHPLFLSLVAQNRLPPKNCPSQTALHRSQHSSAFGPHVSQKFKTYLPNTNMISHASSAIWTPSPI